MLLDIPYVNCYVRRSFLGAGIDGSDPCYIFAVTCIENRPLLFTCHTERGAVFSRLPINAFHWTSKYTYIDHQELQPWSCLSSNACVVKHSYLKDYYVKTKIINGKYLFTIDYLTGGFSEDPLQHKTHNIIQLDNGLFAALPNNECIFYDDHFTDLSKPVDYKRQTTYWVSK